MENYIAYYFLALTVFTFGLLYIIKQSLYPFSYLFFASGAVALFNFTAIKELNINFTVASIVVLVLAFLIGSSNSQKVIYKQFLLPILCVVPVLITWSQSFSIQDYTFNIGPIHLVSIVFGALIHLMSQLKHDVLIRIFKNSNQQQTQLAMQIILAGIGIYLGSFFASFFGVFLVGLGAAVSSFYNKDFRLPIFILVYASFASIIEIQHIDTVDFTLGKIVFGFLVGVFFVLFFNAINSSESSSFFRLIVPLIIQSLLTCLMIWLGTQKTDLGGFDAYLSSIFGVATAQLFVGEMLKNLFVLLISVTIGLFFSVTLKSTNTNENIGLSIPEIVKTGKTEVQKTQDPFDIPGKSMNEIVGNYKIDESNSELTFQLGPKGGITKGAIKQFSGQIELAKEINRSKFRVKLPVSKLTTFNAYRDESLMEASYFNVSKFPEMKYSSTKMESQSDYYVLKGDFELLGKKQKVEVQLKYIGQNEKGVPVLIGKSSLDRTLFGMQPDPKEGNVVDFQFKIELLEIQP
jgi:polyisoprenoid-binding protein YceI